MPLVLRILVRVGIVLLHVGSLATLATLMSLDGYKSDTIAGVVFYVFLSQMVYEGWAVYAYLRYRGGRRDEVLQILRASVASRVPLDPALRMYLSDRKTEPVALFFQLLFALLITPLVPCALILWGLLYVRRFDRQVRDFGDELHEGMPLDEAVTEHRSVLSNEARLAVRVGFATGKLELALDRSERATPPAAWLEIAPRLVYPTLIFTAVASLVTFTSVALIPKYKKIFDEFHVPLPEVTRWMIDWSGLLDVILLQPLVFLLVLFFGTLLASLSSRFCWYLPLFGHYYRREHRGRSMRMLALLLEAEMPAPAALRFLAESEELPDVLRRRFGDAADNAEGGETLATALHATGTLKRSSTAFIAGGQAAGTLPWTLRELGEHECRTALRSASRYSTIFAPLMLLVVAGTVLFATLGLFMPLITLLGTVGDQ